MDYLISKPTQQTVNMLTICWTQQTAGMLAICLQFTDSVNQPLPPVTEKYTSSRVKYVNPDVKCGKE